LSALLLLAALGTSRAGNLFVANYGNNTIEEYSSTGTDLGSFASSGLNCPVGVAFDTNGNLYVADDCNNTIEEYSSTGTDLGSFTSSGLSGPEGLAFDTNGNLYVANDNGNIVKFTSTGGVLSSGGAVVASVGNNDPQGLAFDTSGNLYVANTAGGSGGAGYIEKFRLVGGVFHSAAFGNSGSVLNYPVGLAFDSAGNLYVADDGLSDIAKFNSLGAGAVFSTDVNPEGLAFDSAGNLYEADDSGNIVKFSSTGGVLNSAGTVFASSGMNQPLFLAFQPGTGGTVTGGNSWIDSSSGKWETAANWSSGNAPSLSDSADYITNATSKTVAIDATTVLSNAINGCMIVNNLTIMAPVASTNTLFLNAAGPATPLSVLGMLAIDTNGALVVNSSVVRVSGSLVVGQYGGNAVLTITNGGTVNSGSGSVGATQSGSNNTVLVNGNGAAWNSQGALYVGLEGAGNNQCKIGTGGLVSAGNVYIGYSDSSGSSSNNLIQVNGGNLTVSSGALVVSQGGGPGTLTFNGGMITVNQLVLTNGGNSAFTFNAGTLTSGGTFVTNNELFVVGDGTDAATFDLNGGVHNFFNNLEIRNNATLTGCGTINGNVTVDPGGTVLASCGGVLNFSGTVTNFGSVIAANGTTINFFGPVVNSGVIDAINGFAQFSYPPQNNGTIRLSIGTEKLLYSFMNYPDGELPVAGLVQGSDGNFYGTTRNGGTTNINSLNYIGYGTVFRFTPSTGIETPLHIFTNYPSDGANPAAGLVQGSDGNLYGTTELGGTAVAGTVFRINPISGVYTSLYSFQSTSPTDGYWPQAGLVQGFDGNFYGTTYYGGTTYNGGTAFRITPSGTETILYSFGSGHAFYPVGGLVQGCDSNFYGTTYEGGTNSCGEYGCGAVFRISPSGTETDLHYFGSSPDDGVNPAAGLVQGSDGNLYGTTTSGGTGGGMAFRISTNGTYTRLYYFAGPPNDGQLPNSGLVQGSDGNFYGTTYFGGTNAPQYGTVFKLSVPLNQPPDQTGQLIVAPGNCSITIASVSGETYQLQFATSLTPPNWSDVGSPVKSIGGPLTVTDPNCSGPQGFYRFVITP
jgi:uncharacterized repeat protein (TIGR03803 family)/T5SS/PEP-CTERM-associated repeat protein